MRKHILVLCVGVLMGMSVMGQWSLRGNVMSTEYERGLPNVEVTLDPLGKIVETDKKGDFEFVDVPDGDYQLTVRCNRFDPIRKVVQIKGADLEMEVKVDSIYYTTETFEITDTYGTAAFLRAVDGMAIYAAKKSELIILDEIAANLATNNARQIFNRVAGLNIWESDAGGLQLGIGGRGLSPNRSNNFNTRQNGYPIAADALGYPESYYTPPAEAIKRIEVVRGAASLQYGTQFGGMVNFAFKEGPEDKPFEFISRNTGGSFGLFNTFNSVG
ncbi:MAG: TonB-dependent receptor plug domain-containing protein, partial [Bacteroidota bacterium]